jgi:hypothetical protein
MSNSLPDHDTVPVLPSPIAVRRWVKVSVDEDVFHQLHIAAAESRMRLAHFLRKVLAEARPYQESNSCSNDVVSK